MNKTIIYVNFSPYENTGKILDYILENFENVLLFSFNFHKLGKGQEPSKLKIFKKGELKKEYALYQMFIPASLRFLLLPFRSFVIFLQILWHTLRLKKDYGKYDIYFTVNAFTAWVGNVLKKLGLVEKTIFWVWDYYPPLHEDKIVMFMRWLYWQFDKARTSSDSDRLIFLNKRLESLRKDIGALPKKANYPIVPIGTNPVIITKRRRRQKTVTLGFLGVLKKSQGLDLIFDNAEKIHQLFPNLQFQVIGGGPDEAYFKRKAKKSLIPTVFHGFLPTEKEVKAILSKCDIGLAPFIPEEGNVSYYGDPSKIKVYLSYGLPVITTDVYIFSREIAKEKAGVIIDYYQPEGVIKAISEILGNYEQYQKRAVKLAKKFYYKEIYPEIFKV